MAIHRRKAHEHMHPVQLDAGAPSKIRIKQDILRKVIRYVHVVMSGNRRLSAIDLPKLYKAPMLKRYHTDIHCVGSCIS